MLLAELHLASLRQPELAALIADWQLTQAKIWRPARGHDRDAVVKLFFALLLGICQIESLDALPASKAAMIRQAEALAAVLFPDEEIT